MTWNVPGFVVERRLGEGATGEVWAGRDEATGEPVALKRLRPGRGEADRERLRREAALLAAFRHPHVIGVRGVLGGPDGLVLVLDLASGGSLTELLAERGRLRSGQVVAVFRPLAEALAAAHVAGLLHGDVSPGNVLLGGDGRPFLADLGTARLAGDERAPASGTSGYVDPAVRAGAAPTAASDVYSLAAVAARALTGRAVPDRPDGAQAWADHALTLGVPSALVLGVCEALNPEPERRPDAAALAARLGAAAPAEPLTGVLSSRGERPADLGSSAPPRSAGLPGGGVFAEAEVLTGPGPDAFTRRVPRPAPARPAPEPRPRWLRGWEAVRSGLGKRRTPGTPPPARRPGVATARQLGVAAVAVALVLAAGYAWLAPDDAPTPAPRLAAAPTRAANTPSTPPSTGAPAPASAEQWSALLAELDARRAAAFAQADVRVLDDVYAPGSAALAADRQAVRSLVAARATAAPVRHELRRARVVRSDAASTRLEVVDRMPSYRILDAAGATLRTVAARPDRTVVVDLTRSAGGWRINALTETSR